VRRIALVAILAVASRLEAAGQVIDPLPVFKSRVDVVPISAVVRDPRGRMVTALTATDFEVLDKGERRRILDFRTDDSSAITLAVLVDMSGSMRVGPKLAFAREVLTHLTSDLEDGRDEVGLFTFDAVLHEQQSFTVHPALVDGALGGAEPFGITSLYDAIAETARRLSGRPSLRRAIVVITDGVDTGSALTPPEVSALASSIDAPVYVVATVPAIDRTMIVIRPASPTAGSSADLRDLALWTGGDLLWVSTGAGAALQSRQILFELRHQYLMAIESSAEAEWRPIDVRVRDRHMTVRARSGYFGREGDSR
jgi:Ca-activated chloride channel homolog